MLFKDNLRGLLEKEEYDTVGSSFGYNYKAGIFNVPKIRDWILSTDIDDHDIHESLIFLSRSFDRTVFNKIVSSVIRFSFLIELTNILVGSTKMKTRWVPGKILMPIEGSFEPYRGDFVPGNDQRSSSFESCYEIFKWCLREIIIKNNSDNRVSIIISTMVNNNAMPYEFAFDYINPNTFPVHAVNNVNWVLNDDIEWLIRARPLIYGALTKKEINKIQVKSYKTDRALTGRDKTNRAKRWEVLSGDFQHATLTECWSVERKLLSDLVCFNNFPYEIRKNLMDNGLLINSDISRCPVTLEELDFNILVSNVIHGRSDYQVGHLHPLKRGGKHEGKNVCWQSQDGNRIQGDLTIEETVNLLNGIRAREDQFGKDHLSIIDESITRTLGQ